MSKRLRYLLDYVFGTLFIFGLMGAIFGISKIPIFNSFDPIGDALSDMEMTDLVFSQLREDPEIDTNVVIVNIGLLPRRGIADQIRVINKYDPKVIGLDFDLLYHNEEDLEGDTLIAQAIAEADNLVMMCKILQSDSLSKADPGSNFYDSLSLTLPFFSEGVHFAYANLETDAVQQDDFKACRRYPPQRQVGDSTINAFALEIANQYNPNKAAKQAERNNDWEIINYRGNALDFFGKTNYPTSYMILDWDQVLNEDFVPEMIKNKVVIFGFHGKDLFDTSWDDKFFTPLNRQYAGKTNPDMYGVVVHANIVSMILKEDFVDTWKESTGILFAFLVCFLNVWFFSWIYRRLPRWYDGFTKLIQLLEIGLLVFIMIYGFHLFNMKIDITLTVAAVALVGDGLEVYYGVIKNLFNRESRSRLFTIEKE